MEKEKEATPQHRELPGCRVGRRSQDFVGLLLLGDDSAVVQGLKVRYHEYGVLTLDCDQIVANLTCLPKKGRSMSACYQFFPLSLVQWFLVYSQSCKKKFHK